MWSVSFVQKFVCLQTSSVGVAMGGNQCCVISCRATSHDHGGRGLENGISFYSFPAWRHTGEAQVSGITKRRRMAWIAAVGRPDISFDKIPVSMKVCSRHFQSGQPANEMLEDDPDWVPHLHMKQEEELREQREDNQSATGHTDPGDSQALRPPSADEEEERLGEEEEGEQAGDSPSEDAASDGPWVKRARVECELCSRRRERLNQLLAENEELRYELERLKMNEYFLEEDDEKVRYYTGLQCFAVLMGLLTHLLPHLPDGAASDTPALLSPFQKLLLTLMRLRLDLPVRHLAYLFGVAPAAVTATFTETLGALHAQLGPLVYWPERACLLAATPSLFLEALGQHVAVVLDCLEIGIERPNSIKGREQTYSYQHHGYSMKYLVAMTPQGAVAFVSPALGGRATDLQVAEGSGILGKLSSGDYVLAERGFDIKESVGIMCAQVKTTAFGRGPRQLHVKGEEETRSCAHLRVAIKQVVNGVRNQFALLERTMPISMLLPGDKDDPALLDKIVTVCCALLNMCPNVVEQPDG